MPLETDDVVCWFSLLLLLFFCLAADRVVSLFNRAVLLDVGFLRLGVFRSIAVLSAGFTVEFMLLEDLLKEADKARLEAGVPRMVLCLVIPEFVDFLEDIDLVSD